MQSKRQVDFIIVNNIEIKGNKDYNRRKVTNVVFESDIQTQ